MVIYMEQQKVKQQLLEKKGRTECYKIMYKMWLKEKTHQKYTEELNHTLFVLFIMLDMKL